MDKLSEKIVSMLKSNTYNSVYVNTLAKLPIVVTREGTFNDVIGDTFPIDLDNEEEYLDGLYLIIHDVNQTDFTAD